MPFAVLMLLLLSLRPWHVSQNRYFFLQLLWGNLIYNIYNFWLKILALSVLFIFLLLLAFWSCVMQMVVITVVTISFLCFEIIGDCPNNLFLHIMLHLPIVGAVETVGCCKGWAEVLPYEIIKILSHWWF